MREERSNSRQQAFYQAVLNELTVADQRDLFESLVTFKRNQADAARRLLAEYPAPE